MLLEVLLVEEWSQDAGRKCIVNDDTKNDLHEKSEPNEFGQAQNVYWHWNTKAFE